MIYHKQTDSKKGVEEDKSNRIGAVAKAAPEAAAAAAQPTANSEMPVGEISANDAATVPVPAPSANHPSTIDDSALSRALKRKFTELEEITQRLRARLFDVTGNMTIDPDDQFENDLNTIPDEGDDDFEESNMASEMSLDWLEHCHQAAAAAAAATATFNETNAEHMQHHGLNSDIDNENALSTAQMRDIFEYLSTTDSNQSRPSSNKDDDGQSIDSLLPDKLSSRFNDIINEEKSAWNKVPSASTGSSSVENSIDNIAETLQKSLINE